MKNERELDAFVNREVFCNVGPLVWMLQEHNVQEWLDIETEEMGEGSPDPEDVEEIVNRWRAEIQERAAEILADPEREQDPDPEQARIDAEDEAADDVLLYVWRFNHRDDAAMRELADEQARNDGYVREIYEYWAVSSWLARRLRDAGEGVADLGGMHVWGRCITGQAISMDGVIRRIWEATQDKADPC